MASSSGTEAPGANVNAPAPAAAVVVERSPAAARLSELGVRSWPKWGGPPGRYALRYGARQTCYIVRGKVRATVEGSPERAIEFGAGDLVVFARGARCTWHIAAAVDMHYAFDPT
ncbi:uncharacterized protein LOC133907355 [Phragmites australis]|uniref:uncharacterized protein LOC133907355 n=1 Tax=Phragmites australis TaxID=29695 RepID=UPI002D78B7F0|nr:uncharacterized protein LOC133907355 [Phragmites australis]